MKQTIKRKKQILEGWQVANMQNIPQFAFDEELSQLINFYTSNPYLIPMALELGKSTRQMYAAATARQLLAVSALQTAEAANPAEAIRQVNI